MEDLVVSYIFKVEIPVSSYLQVILREVIVFYQPMEAAQGEEVDEVTFEFSFLLVP